MGKKITLFRTPTGKRAKSVTGMAVDGQPVRLNVDQYRQQIRAERASAMGLNGNAMPLVDLLNARKHAKTGAGRKK